MRKYIAVIALVLLNACSSTSQLHNYQLLDSASGQVAHLDNQKPLYIEPVRMASFIAGPSLVYQVSKMEMVQANTHVWAEDIKQQIRRRMTLDLRGLQGRYWPQQSNRAENYVSIQIDKFQAVYTGNSVISGQWTLVQQGKPSIVKPFEIQQPLDSEGGYQAQVAALSRGISELSQEIAQEM